MAEPRVEKVLDFPKCKRTGEQVVGKTAAAVTDTPRGDKARWPSCERCGRVFDAPGPQASGIPDAPHPGVFGVANARDPGAYGVMNAPNKEVYGVANAPNPEASGVANAPPCRR